TLHAIFYIAAAAANTLPLSLHDALPICHRVLLGVLAHVDPGERPLVVEQELGQRLGQLGLAHPGRTKEQERAGRPVRVADPGARSEEHTSELQSREKIVCRLLLEKKKYD